MSRNGAATTGAAPKRAAGARRSERSRLQSSQTSAWRSMTFTACLSKVAIPAEERVRRRFSHAGRPARQSTSARTLVPSRLRRVNRIWWALLAVVPSSSARSPGPSPWRRCRSRMLRSRSPRAAAASHTRATRPAWSRWARGSWSGASRSVRVVMVSWSSATLRRSFSSRLSDLLRAMRSNQPPKASGSSSESSRVQAARKVSWATSPAVPGSRTMRRERSCTLSNQVSKSLPKAWLSPARAASTRLPSGVPAMVLPASVATCICL